MPRIARQWHRASPHREYKYARAPRQADSFARAFLRRIVPRSVRAEQCIGVLRPPRSASVRDGLVMMLEHWLDSRPRCLDGIFASEERAIPDHRVAQEPDRKSVV